MRKLLLATLLTAGCASAPTVKDYYRPQTRGDATNPWGYSDNKVREGAYFVAATSWDQMTTNTMFERRAGELCGNDGFREFTTSRDMMYAVAVAPAAYFPPGKKQQGERKEGVTREAIVACTKRAG